MATSNPVLTRVEKEAGLDSTGQCNAAARISAGVA
jgi:hypothetical protein